MSNLRRMNVLTSRLALVRTGLVFALSLLTLPNGLAQDILMPGEPSQAGMSAQKLQVALRLFQEAVKKDEIRGVVLLVARSGRIVLHEALGWRNKEKALPMERATLMRTASNGKPIVAAAVQILAEEGRFSIDDEIGKHLPAFNNKKCRGMKIRHLLNHTSGLRIPGLFLEPLMKKSPQHPDAPSLKLEVNRIGEVGPQETPGGAYSYSSAGYNILGALIEVYSKQLLEVFLTQRIYRPLGMADASNYPIAQKVDRMSVVYERKNGEWRVRFSQSDPSRTPFARGSGGTICTTLGYAKFCQMLLNGGIYGGKRLLSEESVREAISRQVRSIGNPSFYTPEEFNTNTVDHGFTWHISSLGVYSCGGADGTFAWIDPKRRLLGLVFTQSSWESIGGREGLNIRFMELVNGACEK